ncbi:MAG: hypothetical protein QME05_03115, partial [Candidatus Margulisbacteria bacterium]|nr:hypothetical protein [Candidatus Margulisiibacteriota bacterium]
FANSHGTFYIDYIDADEDGNFDRAELEGSQIYFTDTTSNTYQKALSAALFRVIDRNMDAKSTDDLDSEGTITQAELERALAIMQTYAEAAGVSLEAAVTAYANSTSFHNIDFAGVRSSGEKVSGWLSTTDMNDNAAIRKALESHVDSRIIDNVIIYVGRLRTAGEPVSAEAIAKYLFRCAMASMAGEGSYDALGFVDSEKANLRTIARFNPDKVNEKKLLDWYEDGEVEEAGSGGGGVGGKDKELKQIYSTEVKKDPALQRQRAAEYISNHSDNPENVLDFYAQACQPGPKNIPGISADSRVIQALMQALTNTEDPNLYAEALRIIKDSTLTGQDKDKSLADLALKYLRLRDQAARPMAKKIAELFTSDSIPWGQDGSPMPVAAIKQEIENSFSTHADIMKWEEDLFKSRRDSATGEETRVLQTTDITTLTTALTNLFQIADDFATPLYHRADAYRLIGHILDGMAKNTSLYPAAQTARSIPSGAGINEFKIAAMDYYRKSWDILIDHKSEDPQYAPLLVEIFAGMVETIEGICQLANSKDKAANKPLVKNLLWFIPNYSAIDIQSDVRTTSGPLPYTPNGYRTWRESGNGGGSYGAAVQPSGYLQHSFPAARHSTASASLSNIPA